jgi:tetratricopeptide (TPR) repeat protein
MRRVLLTPPQMMPTLRGRMYVVTTLSLPPPEYLWLYGAFLTYSDLAAGNWPVGERVGGLDEDFAAGRNLMIDDLHDDVGLPRDEPELRKLSWWLVFPPYGWEMNDGQEYNMMTLVDQILFNAILPRARAVEYLRALLYCQTFHIRNLAARTLLVLGERPLDTDETLIFTQAIHAGDHQLAEGPMLGFAWRGEGRAADTAPTEEWSQRRRNTWRTVVEKGPTEPWRRMPILSDQEYLAAGRLEDAPRAEQRSALDNLRERFPDNWFLETALGTFLVHSEDAAEIAEGERILRTCVQSTPDCPTAHLTLGTALKYQGRRDEAMALFEDAVARWPWHNQAVDSCLWMMTDGMTAKPG